MDLSPGNAQWQGARPEQQDAFGFLGFGNPELMAHGGVLVVLADGMGGMSGGRQASRLAVERMMGAYAQKHPDEPIPKALERSLQLANHAVYELACAGDGEGQQGTTLVAAVVRGAELHWVGVGDSRLYHYRAADDTLTQCTDDHTYANQLLRKVAAGALDPEQAAGDPDRHALSSYLGLGTIPELDANRHPVHLGPGDRLLLCSDGIHGVLELQEIQALLRQAPQAAADALIQAVQAKGIERQDNATVALLGMAQAPASVPKALPERTERRTVPRMLVPSAIAALLALVALVLLWPKPPEEPQSAAGESDPGSLAATPAPEGPSPDQPTEADPPPAGVPAAAEPPQSYQPELVERPSGAPGSGDAVPETSPESAPEPRADTERPAGLGETHEGSRAEPQIDPVVPNRLDSTGIESRDGPAPGGGHTPTQPAVQPVKPTAPTPMTTPAPVAPPIRDGGQAAPRPEAPQGSSLAPPSTGRIDAGDAKAPPAEPPKQGWFERLLGGNDGAGPGDHGGSGPMNWHNQ